MKCSGYELFAEPCFVLNNDCWCTYVKSFVSIVTLLDVTMTPICALEFRALLNRPFPFGILSLSSQWRQYGPRHSNTPSSPNGYASPWPAVTFTVTTTTTTTTHVARDTHFETVLQPITICRPTFCQKHFHIYCLCEYFSDVWLDLYNLGDRNKIWTNVLCSCVGNSKRWCSYKLSKLGSLFVVQRTT